MVRALDHQLVRELGFRKLVVQFVQEPGSPDSRLVRVDGVEIGQIYLEYRWRVFSVDGLFSIERDLEPGEVDAAAVAVEGCDDVEVFVEEEWVCTLSKCNTWMFAPTPGLRKRYRKYVSTLWFIPADGWAADEWTPKALLEHFQEKLTRPLDCPPITTPSVRRRIECLLEFLFQNQETTE